MIASLHGPVISLGSDHAVIECGGVGYLFTATPKTLATLRRGEQGRVITSMVVREDAMTLYGFGDETEKEMFSLLQTVKGLGAKIAVAALATLDPAEIADAVIAGDSKRLQTIAGVGDRMAKRMCLELKGKTDAFATPGGHPGGTGGPVGKVTTTEGEDLVVALKNMGFSQAESEPVVVSVLAETDTRDVGELLKACLKKL
ncbi:Holliday junction branch migration protein RuvA [Corynebacterium mendelii]|uniref:Holliday junction branch migration complex subunit RuvA n=1 Tax=Corynebacterium mendelii TaxID=2765362 RepID=A0A939DYV8_9CORY|nr:Holliday junction branch migration protein RuvA [Corynebacterium mendelii]MBN9643376.1 Holliday junction branch migration protein RuvA [Corynebacterium mendelii]